MVASPRRVMVGTDRSATAERAVRWAAELADRYGADLHVVQVIVPVHLADQDDATAELTRTAAIDDLVGHARSLAGERGRSRVVIDDDPAMAIVRAAEEEAIDVLVVGNAGMAGRKEFLLGNVPNRISHNARCTVIIVNSFAPDGEAGAAPTRRPHDEPRDEKSRLDLVSRGGKIAAVFARHGLRELFGRPDEAGAVGSRRQAKRVRAALEELGPTFAKLGQLLSTRPDLLPPEFVEELAQLQDNVSPLGEEQVVGVMEQDLGVPWEDVFETIEPSPLAAGTIAQVHRASLASGEKVVVKVQRPDARAVIEQDLALLRIFSEKVGARPGVRQVIDVGAVFEHLSTSLQRELDFRREARNAERLRAAVADFARLAVPRVHADLSTTRLLVMQDVGGVPVSAVPPGSLRRETAQQLLESFYKQILIDGFFHADPHPGNFMWQPEEERLYFLDLGMVGEVGAEMRELMVPLLMALWQEDVGFVTDLSAMLSGAPGQSDLDVEAFTSEIQALMTKYRGATIKDIQLGPLLHEMTVVSYRHGVPLPASLSLTAKTLAQMQLVAAQLDPDVDPLEVAGRYLMRSLLRGIGARSDPKTIFYQSQKMRLRAMRVFEAIERLTGARPGQKLEVNFRAESLDETVRRAGRRLTLGLMAGFALLTTGMTAASERVGAWLPAAFGCVAAVLVVALAADFVRGTARRS